MDYIGDDAADGVTGYAEQLLAWFQTLDAASKRDIVSLESVDMKAAVIEMLREMDPAEPLFGEESIPEYSSLEDIAAQTVAYIRKKNPLCSVGDKVVDEVAQGGNAGIARLLQLTLVCSVLCPLKEEYINSMRCMPSDITLTISQAILEFLPLSNETEQEGYLVKDSRASSGDSCCGKCVALQNEVAQISKERAQLMETCAKLKTELEFSLDLENERSPASKKLAQLQKEINVLRETSAKLEASRDEYRVKVDSLQQQNHNLVLENDQFRKQVQQAELLKDEVDELRIQAGHVSKLEAELRQHRKKADETSDLKAQLKASERRLLELSKKNEDLEDERSRLLSVAETIDSQTKELEDMRGELRLSTLRLQNSDAEVSDLRTQLATLSQRRQRTQDDSQSGDITDDTPLGASLSFELEQRALKEEVARLQVENEALANRIVALEGRPPVVTAVAERQPNASEIPLAQEPLQTASSLDAAPNLQTAQIPEDQKHRIRHLEEELEFLRSQHAAQLKLMTTAWYRLGQKAEKQSTNVRLFGSPEGISSSLRPKSFLEEQRSAINAPVFKAQPSPSLVTSVPTPKPRSASYFLKK